MACAEEALAYLCTLWILWLDCITVHYGCIAWQFIIDAVFLPMHVTLVRLSVQLYLHSYLVRMLHPWFTYMHVTYPWLILMLPRGTSTHCKWQKKSTTSKIREHSMLVKRNSESASRTVHRMMVVRLRSIHYSEKTKEKNNTKQKHPLLPCAGSFLIWNFNYFNYLDWRMLWMWVLSKAHWRLTNLHCKLSCTRRYRTF